MARSWPVERALPVAGRRRPPPDPPIRADQIRRTFRFPVAPHRARVDRRSPARGHHTGGTSAMTSHDTGSTGTPGTPRATAPPARTFGPQGPTLGELSDAYLQDYQVRQFRSPSTARGRITHLVAFFGRDAHAAALTTYQIRQYQLARRGRRGRHRHHQSRDLGPPPYVHACRPRGAGWTHVPGFPDRLRENGPAPGLLRAPRIPRRPLPTCPLRGRTSSTSPTTLAGARTRSSASLGRT